NVRYGWSAGRPPARPGAFALRGRDRLHPRDPRRQHDCGFGHRGRRGGRIGQGKCRRTGRPLLSVDPRTYRATRRTHGRRRADPHVRDRHRRRDDGQRGVQPGAEVDAADRHAGGDFRARRPALEGRDRGGRDYRQRTVARRMAGQFELSEDQLAIQEMARRFTAERIVPFAAEWDEKHVFPKDTIKAAAELGFASIYVSEESGGSGLGRLEAALIMEAMAYGCPSPSAFISIHNMANWMIDRFGSAEIKAKYLPQLVGMEWMASYCLTEPSSGSDAAALKTRAVRDGDDWVVTGTKQF